MGMFDEIRVAQVLPGNSEITDTWYQTKSFDNVMSKYVITAKGELYEETWEYKWIDDPERPFFKGYLEKIEGTYKRNYLTDFHGDIKFYEGMRDDFWRDYYARFTEGKLTKMWYKDTKF